MPVGILVLLGILVLTILILGVYYVRLLTKPQQLSSIAKDIETKNYALAIKRLQAILQRNPEDHEAHRMLAKAYQGSGNIKMAIVEYRFAEKGVDHEVAAYEIDVRSSLAGLLHDNKEYKEALEEYVLLLKIDPKNAEAYHKAALCYQKLGAFDRAVQYFKLAVKANPQLQEAYFDLGVALFEAENYQEALNELAFSIKYNPKNYRAYYYMGVIYRNLQDFVKAVECLDAAERDKEVQVQAIMYKALCYVNIGNLAKVIEECTRGLRIHTASDQTSHILRYTLAEAHETRKDITSALEQWEKIYSQNPKFRDVASKLEQYQDVRASDVLKDYMSSPAPQFQQLCQRVVDALGLVTVDARLIHNDEVQVTARESTKMVGKTLLKFLIFTRYNEPLNEAQLRGYLDLMKTMNCQITILFSNSGFNRQAREFGSSRPFEMFDAKKINELLTLPKA